MTGERLSSLLARTPRLGAAQAARIAAGVLARVGEGPPGGLRAEGILVEDGEVVGVERSGDDAVDYAAPEAALGEALDEKADVYAVGVMLYEMIAGRRPFEGKTRGEVVNAHLLKEPPPLDELDALVRKALAKKREERWGVEELRARLVEAAGGPERAEHEHEHVHAHEHVHEGTAALSTEAVAPAPRSPPRHPRLAMGIGLAVAVLFVGWCALRRGPPPLAQAFLPQSAIPPVVTTRVEDLIARGDLAAARAQAEQLARAYPREGRAFALLGDVLFAQGEKERALAAYREAQHLDPRVGADPTLLANLRATFPDAQHGEAAFRLAERIGAPAEPVLSDLAAQTGSAVLKRRAAEAIGRIGKGQGEVK